jgi:SNF2 family DNA or RNA helicase
MVAFKHELARVRKRFPQAQFVEDFKGIEAQKKMLAAWNAKQIPMLVANPKSMSHGLNMQDGGSNMIWVSLTYSRDDYEQAIGRLERRGQDEVVKVWRLMVPDTVDEVIATVVEDKRVTEDRLLTALQLLESYREGAVPRKKLTIKHEEDFC